MRDRCECGASPWEAMSDPAKNAAAAVRYLAFRYSAALAARRSSVYRRRELPERMRAVDQVERVDHAALALALLESSVTRDDVDPTHVLGSEAEVAAVKVLVTQRAQVHATLALAQAIREQGSGIQDAIYQLSQG